MRLPHWPPARDRARTLAVLALGATLATGGVPASAFTATPEDGPVAPSPGSLMPGTPTGEFRTSGQAPGPQLLSGSADEPATLQRDLQDAQDVVNDFWRRHWTEDFGGHYDPPSVLGSYDGDNRAGTPKCGGHPLERDNAAYCPDGDFLAWDDHLMRNGFGRGDGWVYMVIAHEWGHAVQHRMPSSLVSDRTELQADCLAGAALHGAARDGELRFEPGDTDEIVGAFRLIGDGTPWTRPGDHGTSAQRIAEFTLGGTGGVHACLD
ncbi:neutral zinc metallopeptidase [Actinomadura rupiterrae]|uniref:neutral zinc metallopeptidase n=1 Tax=Actinomadura rupiterrae TaxID=559627 RepID=UPI0020A5D79B|nr:neutral zinc metallopeptidase [Actinomadura rupiterrae]MCP2338636.1 hypothetical protein [Actinomadura rupiterrae]